MTVPFHFRADRAVRASDLPAPARHLLMVIYGQTDRDGHIPDRWQPSLADLAGWTGLSLTTVKKYLRACEDAGWLIIERDLHESIVNHQTNRYRPLLPVADADKEGDAWSRSTRGMVARRPSPQSPGDHNQTSSNLPSSAAHAGASPMRHPDEVHGDDDRYERVRRRVEANVGSFDGFEESTVFGLFWSYDDGARSEAALVSIITNILRSQRGES